MDLDQITRSISTLILSVDPWEIRSLQDIYTLFVTIIITLVFPIEYGRLLNKFYWKLNMFDHAIHVGKNESYEWRCQN